MACLRRGESGGPLAGSREAASAHIPFLTLCMTLSKSFVLSGPQFTPLWKEGPGSDSQIVPKGPSSSKSP